MCGVARRAGARVEARAGAAAAAAVALHAAEQNVPRVGGVEPRPPEVVRLVALPKGGLERPLSCRGNGRRDARLSAVAVVHVKVEDGDAADGVAECGHGVRRADGDVVEEAEAVRAARVGRVADGAERPGVVAWGPHGAERARRLHDITLL